MGPPPPGPYNGGMPERKVTTDHGDIRRWVEERQGRPTTVRGTGGEVKAGVLRVDFPGHKAGRLEDISWEEFFQKFDEKRLAFLYQETTSDGKSSRFCKFVRRDVVGMEGQGSETLQGETPANGHSEPHKPPPPKALPEEQARWEGESPAAARVPD